MKMKQLPLSERPYEKLEMYGETSLSNSELLAIIIKSGTKEESSVEIAQKILKMNTSEEVNSMRFLQDVSIEELKRIKGIGKVKAIQLKAICELSKRISRPIHTINVPIRFPSDVSKLLMDELRYEKKELVKVIILNNKNIVLKIVDAAIGGGNFAVIEPKQVLTDAIKIEAPKIILVHNHPSGDPTPSKGDILVTERIQEAAEIMGIELLDHVVIGDGKFVSILAKKKGMGKNETI